MYDPKGFAAHEELVLALAILREHKSVSLRILMEKA